MSSMWKALVFLVAASAVQAQVRWNEVKSLEEFSTGDNKTTQAKQRTLVSRMVAQHIVGGYEARPHQFPFQVAIVIDREDHQSAPFCGGSILSESIILTAAHCALAGHKFEVIAGAHDITAFEESQQIITTTLKKVHEAYGEDGVSANDIALLYLPEKLEIHAGIIEPIRLPSSECGDYWLKRTITSGWGWSHDGSGVFPVLRFVESRVVSNFYCRFRYFFIGVNENNICISGWKKKGTCHGDSGGPLVIQEEDGLPTLIGITSFGVSFGCELSWPTVFVRVSSYLGWIKHESERMVLGVEE